MGVTTTVKNIVLDYHQQEYIQIYAHQFDSGQIINITVQDNGNEPDDTPNSVRVKVETPDGRNLMLTNNMPYYQKLTTQTMLGKKNDWDTFVYWSEDNANYKLAKDIYPYDDTEGSPTYEQVEAGHIFWASHDSSGNLETYIIINEDKTITIKFPQSVFLDGGKVECELVLYGEADATYGRITQLATMHFIYLVEDSVYDEDDVLSDSSATTILEGLIADTKGSAEICIAKASAAKDSALKSQSYATGDAKNDDGSDYRTGQDKDNAKYYYEQAKGYDSTYQGYVSTTKGYMETTEGYKDTANDWALYAQSYAKGNAKKSDGSDYRTGQSTDNAEYFSTLSESWATGEGGSGRTGEDKDNSKYYAALSESYANGEGDAGRTGQATDNAKAYSETASDKALYSQSYATGDAKKSDGTDYRTGQDKDNAKYYADKAQEYAGRSSGITYAAYKTWAEFEVIMADPTTEDFVSYCITEDFKTTSDFLIGENVKYRAYTVVFRNASQKWVAFASPNAGGGGITVSDTEPTDMDVNTFWMCEY